ncbi:tetratricopeptide repeat protein [Microbulbifer spongiae]|uniref:Tetratricopeptide repeat protein n=1 Tax=Microbulbifer spongiae TaxID=2944933 RepID=A0ABY9E8X6_9GAMM|nr:tetratricopeptide repeat protein [Microbulbifer sp. MI-G]WKD48895.1 tetratricopeptide repeat protein [Microbulbifer sp. MI-G]
MELQYDDETARPTHEQLDNYSNLCKRGLYLDALDTAERDFGPLHNWQHSELRIIAVKALSNLGLRRSADAIIFRSWRRNRREPKILPYYLQATLARRGPLAAWEAYRQLEQAGFPEDADRAFLQCIEAELLSRYRDFASADRCLREAEALDNSNWVRLRRAHLLLDSDQHQQALEFSEQLHHEDPDYLAAVHCYAGILQCNDQPRRALALLQPYWEKSQSLPLGRQLCQLAIELRQSDTALNCLEKMERLMVRGCPKHLRREQDNLWADYHCTRGDYDAALPYLEQKSFYHQRISESIRKRGDKSERRILELPYIQQRHMTCAPASMAAVQRFWGQAADQDEIAEAICYNGTSNYDERAWLEKQGWRTIEFDLNFPQLKQLIDREIPVLLSTVEPGSAHLQVIAGYDRATGTYLLRDPSHPRLQEILIEESERYYAASGPRCTAAVPAKEAQRLEGLQLRSAPLYDDSFQLQRQLKKHDHAAACAIADKMQTRDARHRLTLRAQLDLAYYVQDDGRILQLTEQLLEQFPDDINLQLAKIQTLSRLDAATESLNYMEALEKNSEAHFLIRSHLADSLRFDHRNDERVEKLLSNLLRRNPLHPQTLYARAGHLWDRGEYESACTLYRFVTCLEETWEGYADSYFKAERFLRRTDTALEFLRDRFRRFGKKSSGPAISLFHALDALNRAEEGLEILHTGIELRSQDGDLMLFTARRLLYLNRAAEAEALAGKAKPFANKSHHLALVAEIHADRQRRDKAIALWQQVLQTEPLNYDACNTIVRLYTEQDQYNQAIDFLDRKIETYPGNYRLQRMRLTWLADDEVERIEDCCRQLIDSHPDDNWAYVRLAHLCTQRARLDEALEYAREATRISRTDTDAWVQLGQVYQLRQQSDAATGAFKQAIGHSCDCTSAFAPLLQSAHGLEEKRELLAFIYGELMRQVSYGDGVLAYQDIAREWLPVDELLKFLHLALQQRPDLWQCWLALANGYRQQGNLVQAQATLLTAIKRFPLLPRLHLELAEVQRLRGDLPAAEARLCQALELNPDWADLHNNLAELLEYQGKYSQAMETLEAAIQRLPRDPVPRGYLADLLWRRGERQRAVDEIGKCIELSPFYGWAWRKFFQWSRELGDVQVPGRRMAEARRNFPNSAMLVGIDAEFREDPRERAQLLAAFADNQPHTIEIVERYIEALAECGEFERACTLCGADYWRGKIPLEIRTSRALLARQQGKRGQALKEIREVTAAAPYHYEGWRLLANWALEWGEKDSAREALQQCRALHPNDASVLTFVAEGLQKLEAGEKEILPLLERAFEAEPSNQYNGLTYLDLLIESRDWPRAREVVDLIKQHGEDAFVLTRELQICAAEERESDALLALWERLLQHRDSNDWVIRTGWQVLVGGKLKQAAAERIEALRAQDKTLHPYAGYRFAKYQLLQFGKRRFERQFRKLTQADAFTQRSLECYLDQLLRRDEKPSGSFVDRLESLIAGNPVNWGTYGMLLFRQGQWYRAKNWFSNWRQQAELQAWILYFASLSFRQSGDYGTGREIMAEAYQLPDDNLRGDIICIHTIDRMLEGDLEAAELLEHAPLGDLDGFSSYALALSQVLSELGDGNFVDCYSEVSPKLRGAQHYFQQTGNAEIAKQWKRRLRARLKDGLQQTGLKKLFWLWRLSNHL